MTRDPRHDPRVVVELARARAAAPPGMVPVLVSIDPVLTSYHRPGQDTRVEGWTLGIRYEVRDGS